MTDKKTNDPVEPAEDADDIVSEPLKDGDEGDQDLADDFVEIDEADETPEELREDTPDPATLPATGLVSEFHDLTASQAAYLVSHRETSSVSRSPLFYVSALLLGVSVIAALIVGFQRAGAGIGDAPETLAVVGVDQEQADGFGQQLGLPVVSVEDQEAGEAMLRSGEAGAVYVLDPTGMQQASLLALDRDPQSILDVLNQPIPVDYLEPPAVAPAVSDPVAWGLAIVVAVGVLTLGAALTQNLRTEKRNRLAEVIASTIPARASAWGRVYGLTLLFLTFPVLAGAVLLVGLSISASRRVRRVGYGAAVVLTVAGVLAPLVLRAEATVMLWLSYAPLTSPVAMPMRYMAGQAEWWEGLVAAGISAVVGFIVYWLSASAYQRTLLRGGTRSFWRRATGGTSSTGIGTGRWTRLSRTSTPVGTGSMWPWRTGSTISTSVRSCGRRTRSMRQQSTSSDVVGGIVAGRW
jgi:ABC-2 type transport system permease protein